jgi:hypothetical protein
MPYTPHAQIIESETCYTRRREPTPAQLTVIEECREAYRQTLGAYPAGDALGLYPRIVRLSPPARWATVAGPE